MRLRYIPSKANLGIGTLGVAQQVTTEPKKRGKEFIPPRFTPAHIPEVAPGVAWASGCNKGLQLCGCNPLLLWRRDRDSNPRYLSVHLISSHVKFNFNLFHLLPSPDFPTRFSLDIPDTYNYYSFTVSHLFAPIANIPEDT